MRILFPFILLLLFVCCNPMDHYDLIIRNGTVYDGSGSTPDEADIAINADTIAAIGDLNNAAGTREIDAEGLVVAPGFINMLSWANASLIVDGRSQSDIRQGVTLEVMGEGSSMGPVNEMISKDRKGRQGDIRYDITWSTLGEYLDYLVDKGVSTNIASFVGNGTVRQYVLGYENRAPDEEELNEMKQLVRQAMEEGAMGMSSALIYVPSSHADTEELIELCKVVSEYGGMYISHIRDEGDSLLYAIDELITIAREVEVDAEVYHLKASGKENWHKLDSAIMMIEEARDGGYQITADIYNYPASSTGLNTVLPDWALEGGHNEMIKRLVDPTISKKIKSEIEFNCSPDSILLVGFRNPELKSLTGKSLAEVARSRALTPEEAVIDLIVEDDSRIGTVFFTMSEKNLRKKIAIPWVSFCSDAASMAPEGVFLERSTHPRAYGSFARLIGKYVREEQVIPLEEAIRKLTSLPASNLKIDRRGMLKEGNFADIVVFDFEKVEDHSTFSDPHQYATGFLYVIVNGTVVLDNGEHTGAMPGRVVRGPGWKGRD